MVFAAFLCGLVTAALPFVVSATMVTTTLSISICGDAIVNPGEVCDDGLFNTGDYGSSTAQRTCNSTCTGYGPYCGDGVLQAYYTEQCDDGASNGIANGYCTLTCTQVSPPVSTTTPPVPPPVSSGGGGGGGSFQGIIPVRADTRVIIQGKAYPGATVNILKDGQVIGQVASDNSADFLYEMGNVTPGATTFGFWATDGRGVRSLTFTTTFQVTQNAVTTVSNVFLPPTLSLRERKVAQGGIVESFGTSAPNARVSLFVDKDTDARSVATSTSDGSWTSAFATGDLANEAFHAVRAMFEQFGSGDQAKSGFSQSVNFYIGERDVQVPGSADLNKDGKVNLVDFSILLFHWGTSNPTADINADTRTDLTDFSIMLFNWTG